MTPENLIRWTLNQHRPTIVSTSLGDQSAVLLHMVASINLYAPIIWVDTGFNTSDTLKFADDIQDYLNIKLIRYVAEPWTGEVPFANTPEHNAFVDHVKLNPFRQVLLDLQPEFWITGVRRTTEHRQTMKQIDQVDGVTKISPLLEWSSKDMDDYIAEHKLPNESNYFDPTKISSHLECGLHTRLRVAHL
jgi:phosphoadenosine phosphosulfate reductase